MSPTIQRQRHPIGTVRHGAGGQLDELLDDMEENSEYVHLVTHHQRRYRISPEDMVAFMEKLCGICMPILMAAGGSSEMATSKLQRLQRDLKKTKEDLKAKLVQCNLSALKQSDLVKGGTGKWDDKVTFYEPMKYLNEDEKDMVFMVVKDKLRQILDGTAPDSFMGKLRESLGMADPAKLLKKQGSRSASAKEEEEEDFANQAVEIARNAAKKSQEVAALAQRETEELKKRLVQLQQQLDDRGTELTEAQQLLAQGERYRQQLLLAMDRLKEQQLEPEEASFVMSELSKSTEGFQVLFEDMPEDCTFLEVAQWHEATLGPSATPLALELHHDPRRRRSSVVCKYAKEAQAEAAVRQLQNSASKSGKWSKVRARLLPSQTSDSTVTPQAMNRSRTGESWRSKSNVTRSWSQDLRKKDPPDAEDDATEPLVTRKGADFPKSHGDSQSRLSRSKSAVKLEETQAEIGKKAQKIEELTEENKKLKVCLEELQAKLRQLMGKSKERGIGDEISEIANDLGLKRVLSCPSRFDILYQDAFKRIERLEELRAKIREERHWMQGPPAPAEPSVLSLVERSPLVILQQLVTTGPAGWSLSSGHSPKRAQRPRPSPLEHETPSLSPKTSKSMSKLPQLPRLEGPATAGALVSGLKESASTPCLRAMQTPIHPIHPIHPMGWEADRRVGVHWKQADRRVLV